MKNIWQKLLDRLARKEDRSAEYIQNWRKAAEQAKLDWIYAHKYYDTLTDTDLIDYAIYMILANERKYMYIIRKIKNCESYPLGLDKKG